MLRVDGLSKIPRTPDLQVACKVLRSGQEAIRRLSGCWLPCVLAGDLLRLTCNLMGSPRAKTRGLDRYTTCVPQSQPQGRLRSCVSAGLVEKPEVALFSSWVCCMSPMPQTVFQAHTSCKRQLAPINVWLCVLRGEATAVASRRCYSWVERGEDSDGARSRAHLDCVTMMTSIANL